MIDLLILLIEWQCIDYAADVSFRIRVRVGISLSRTLDYNVNDRILRLGIED